jgi:hypothetical protein
MRNLLKSKHQGHELLGHHQKNGAGHAVCFIKNWQSITSVIQKFNHRETQGIADPLKKLDF